jgi:hypothetical protein
MAGNPKSEIRNPKAGSGKPGETNAYLTVKPASLAEERGPPEQILRVSDFGFRIFELNDQTLTP